MDKEEYLKLRVKQLEEEKAKEQRINQLQSRLDELQNEKKLSHKIISKLSSLADSIGEFARGAGYGAEEKPRKATKQGKAKSKPKRRKK